MCVVSGVAVLPFTCSFNATCVCCKWCCCIPLHLQLTPHVYVVSGITALPSTHSRVVVLVGYASVYVLPKLCSCIGWFVILCLIYVLVFMYFVMLCVCCIYLFVLSHHTTSTHVLHSQPHASRWTAYLLPPRGAVWDLQHSVLMLNGDNCMHFYYKEC